MDDIQQSQTAAIEQFVIRCTVPILYEDGELCYQRGTGTLFTTLGRHFLVSARHVFDNIDLERLASPLGPKNGTIMTWGTFELSRLSSDPTLDVAVVEFQYGEFIEALKGFWRFISLDQVAIATPGAEHWLAGYPAALTTVTPAAVNQRPFILKTAMLDHEPGGAKEPRPERDLFFGLEREGTVASGAVLETPRLEGASGCSVWELTGYDGSLWTPDKAVKIVGVQQSALHQQWFRATRWEAVLPVLYSLTNKVA